MQQMPTAPTATHPLIGEARAWLAEMQDCVRARNYAKARSLFVEDVTSFGTQVNSIEVRLDEVEREQWREVWPRLRNFTYRTDESLCYGDKSCLVVLVQWDSVGARIDNSTFDRPGRTTFVLARQGDNWKCIHFHSSLVSHP